MTTKQIAESVNKSERSVQRWAKTTGDKMTSIGDKVASVGKTGVPADYTIDETIAIIETGMGKNAADLYRMNAKQPVQNGQADRLDRLESLMDKMLVAMGNMMILQQTPAKQQERVMLPAPQLDPRAHVKKLIDQYVSRNQIEHAAAYRYLYSEFGYRTKCNPSLSAKNRGMNTIDYIESEGMIETLEAIAMEVL